MHILTITNASSLIEWITELQEFQLDSYFDTHILGRSYAYIKYVDPDTINDEYRTYTLDYTTKYEIKLKKVGNNIKSACSCPYDQLCKHIAAVILWEMKLDLKC